MKNKKDQEVFPKEKYSVYAFKNTKTKMPMLFHVNEGYKKYAYRNKFPWHLTIIIRLENFDEVYMPSQGELAMIYELERLFDVNIVKVSQKQFIGRQILLGQVILHYYIDNAKNVNDFLQGYIKSRKSFREFKYEIRKDDNWLEVDYFLRDAKFYEKGISKLPYVVPVITMGPAFLVFFITYLITENLWKSLLTFVPFIAFLFMLLLIEDVKKDKRSRN